MKDIYFLDCKPFILLNMFFESTWIKPLLDKSIVVHKDIKYRVERYFDSGGHNHCYVFVSISEYVSVRPFARKPSDVERLIKEGIITVDKLFNWE